MAICPAAAPQSYPDRDQFDRSACTEAPYVKAEGLAILMRRLVARIVMLVVIFESERADGADLRDIFTGLRPMKMPGLAGQHDDAARRIGLHLFAVEFFAEADVEHARHDS